MLNENYYNFTNELCNWLSKNWGCQAPPGTYGRYTYGHNPNLDLEYFVLIAEFINLYYSYIDELIPSSKKFCSIYSPHQ